MTTVALYARVSSQNQAQKNTIESQIAELRHRIAEDKHELLNKYEFKDNGVSGWILERESLEALRDRVVEGEIDKIYIHSLDRLSRKSAHQMFLLDEFEKAGVEVIFLNYKVEKNPESRLFLKMQGLLSECETLRTMERSRGGRIHRARKGEMSVINVVPFGFRRINHVDRDKIRIEINEEEAKIVRDLFKWVGQERISIKGAVRRLKERCILSPKGKRVWNVCTIHRILRNRAYKEEAAYGKTKVGPLRKEVRARWKVRKKKYSVYNNEEKDWIKIRVPRIIEDELFDIVQKQLDENRKRARAQQSGRRHLLQGLTTCGCCKYTYYIAKNAKEGSRYYRCTGTDANRFGGTRVCSSKSIRAEILEMVIWDETKRVLKDPNVIAKEYKHRLLEHKNGQPNDEVEKERGKLEQGIKRLAYVYARGHISQEEYDQEVEGMEKRLKVMKKQQEEMVNEKELQRKLDFTISNVKDFASEIKSELDQADWKTKFDIIRELVDYIKIDNDHVHIMLRFQAIALEMQRKNVQHHIGIPRACTFKLVIHASFLCCDKMSVAYP
ncbi:recombinase family protein [Candidatus Wolbachia massiliensis]|uniref:Recombinase family protein n=1 Tax=Candidatus Wolbachia massiliensis TaxID=1845000 RepID=A0A7M3U297_9RICK|nr:recombinase family protein [Candidatus Wolbachia massiliensis]QOD38532.1 recombinase family protein [Candidatus Wolbachia massiliensis]